MEFQTVDRPVGSETGPNPYTEHVRSLWDGRDGDLKGKALTFTTPAGEKTAKGNRKGVTAAQRLLKAAGDEVGCTVRKRVNVDGDTATITFWTVPKVANPGRAGNGAAKKTAAAKPAAKK